MKKFCVAVLLAATAQTSALGADIGPPVYKAPIAVVVSESNWNGFYIGGHAGWIRPDIQTTDAGIFGAPFPKMTPDSAGIGFQAGVQRQFGSVVLGVEGGLTAPVGDHYVTRDFPTLPGNDTVFRAGITNIWFVGPRLGYAAGNWMPYVTGGYANTSLKAQNIQFGIPIVLWNERRDGWYLGGGVDWAIGRNWVLGLDYRHYDFGDSVIIPTVNGALDPFDAAKFKLKADAVTLRLSYRIGQ
jgi:outer membrane immunogenic protein